MNKNNLKSFNMNSEVAVKLSEVGKQHLIDYYSQFDYGIDYLKIVSTLLVMFLKCNYMN